MSSMHHLQLLFNDARMGSLMDTLDELHSAASEGRLQQVTTLTNAELIGWLYELVYTATETMAEIQRAEVRGDTTLHIVAKSEAS
ncbi:MAG: hypothetical protein IAE89_02495 [Anaerolineae bacterium]|nr:hypothetical protein [Anaerolineae bacterium]